MRIVPSCSATVVRLMAIIRPPMKSKHFTQVPNHWIRDRSLSMKALGLMTYICSHASDYRLTVEQMVAEHPDGKHAVNSAIKELEARGYLVRVKHRRSGRFAEYDYQVVEFPPPVTVAENQQRFSRDGKSSDGKSATKNTNTKNTKDLEDEDQNTSPSLSSGHVATAGAAASVPQQRERERQFAQQKFKSHAHRLIAEHGWNEAWQDWFVEELTWRNDINGTGWFIAAKNNGTLLECMQVALDDYNAEHKTAYQADGRHRG